MSTISALTLALASPVEGEAVVAAVAAAVDGPCVDALAASHLKRENPAQLSDKGRAFFAKHGLTVTSDETREAFFWSDDYWPVVGSMPYGRFEVLVAIDREGQCAVAVASNGNAPSDEAVEAALLELGWVETISIVEDGSHPPSGFLVAKRIGDADVIFAGGNHLSYPNKQFA